MSNEKLEPYLPFYSKPPNVVIKKWEEDFELPNGNRGVLTKILFKDKKNKEHETIASVKWLYIAPPPEYPPLTHTLPKRTEQ